jgi:hypothetical protein
MPCYVKLRFKRMILGRNCICHMLNLYDVKLRVCSTTVSRSYQWSDWWIWEEYKCADGV